jgi:aryl-alcohol dehydrogenase-like predicted oxidoreductase
VEYRRLGKTALKVSPLCMGTMQFGWSAAEALSQRILTATYEAGINFIDTADVYSRWVKGNPGGVAETIIGKWLKASKVPRQRLIIATKVRGRMWAGTDGEGLSRKHILRAVEDSLRRLQTEYIDLYQTHFPDENVAIEETLRALDDLVKLGKVRYVGCSNYQAAQLQEALDASAQNGLVRYETLQPHYNLIHRAEFEAELADLCRKEGLGVIPYSPLEGGFLTGKYRRGQPQPESVRAGNVRNAFTDQNFNLLERMETMAKARNVSVSQLALAWLLSDPLITSPIIGPRSLEQLQDNLGALDVALTPDEKAQLNQLSHWR